MNDEKGEKCSQVIPRWESFLCGWLAGFVNISVTFPLHKAMFRQMLHGVPTIKAIGQLRKEGLHTLYRGIGPPICQKTVSTSIMFGNYEYFGDLIRNHYPGINIQASKSLGAAMAGLSEIAYTQPFERIQTLLQDRNYNSKFKNTYSAARQIYHDHGATEFYRGTVPVIIRNMLSNVIFFASREKVAELLPPSDGPMKKYLSHFVSGALIGAMTSTLMYPTNVVKTKMQSRVGGEFVSPIETYQIILRERGTFRSLYRGVHINFTRSLLSWGITNASYEFLQETLDEIRCS